jgi:hypothetical protein
LDIEKYYRSEEDTHTLQEKGILKSFRPRQKRKITDTVSIGDTRELLMDEAHGLLLNSCSLQRACLIIVFFALIGPCMPGAQAMATQGEAANNSVRPCKVSGSTQQPKSLPSKQKKSQGTFASDSSSACIEIHSEVLVVQEFLQKWVRSLNWKLVDEHTNENSWDFSRKLTVNELMGFTKSEGRVPGIEWQSGSAFVQITTTVVNDGFARTVIHAQFRGIGENKDKLATPRDWYPLESNGSLESSMADALTKHFGALKH